MSVTLVLCVSHSIGLCSSESKGQAQKNCCLIFMGNVSCGKTDRMPFFSFPASNILCLVLSLKLQMELSGIHFIFEVSSYSLKRREETRRAIVLLPSNQPTNQSELRYLSVHPSHIYICDPDRDSHPPARLWRDVGAAETTRTGTRYARRFARIRG